MKNFAPCSAVHAVVTAGSLVGLQLSTQNLIILHESALWDHFKYWLPPYPFGCYTYWLLIYTACNSICQIIIQKSSRFACVNIHPHPPALCYRHVLAPGLAPLYWYSECRVRARMWRRGEDTILFYIYFLVHSIFQIYLSCLFLPGKSRILEQDHVLLPGPRLAIQAARSPLWVCHHYLR